MSILTKILRQHVVYWAPGPPDEFGKPTALEPIDLLGRWEDVVEQVIGPGGTLVVSKSRVYVGQDLEIGGFLLLGSLRESVSTGGLVNPKLDGAMEIVSFTKTPNIRASQFLRIAYLSAGGA